MKVALLVPGGVDRSGTERVIPALLWLIGELGREHELHVFAREQEVAPSDWDIPGARVHNIGTLAGHRRRLLRTFREEHHRSPFAIVHGIFGWGGAWAAVLGKRHGLPVVFHAAGGEFVAMSDIDYGMRSNVRDRIALGVATSGAAKVTVATESMRALAAEHGVSATVVPLGVDLGAWPSSPPRARDTLRPIRLLHIGDLRPVKDQATLLRALNLLAASGVAFEADFCGFDTLHGSIQESSDAREIRGRTRWHGVLGRSELRTQVNQADLLVMASRHEAGPLAVLEAAIAGVPTVGTAVGHIADWSPTAAVAVPIGDSAALAHAISDLAMDEARRLDIAHEAQRLALAMDVTMSARAFTGIYAELCSA